MKKKSAKYKARKACGEHLKGMESWHGKYDIGKPATSAKSRSLG